MVNPRLLAAMRKEQWRWRKCREVRRGAARRDGDAGRCGEARGGAARRSSAGRCGKAQRRCREGQRGTAEAWCGFRAILGVFGSYLGVERSDYGAVATDDDFFVTRGLAVKGIMWLRK